MLIYNRKSDFETDVQILRLGKPETYGVIMVSWDLSSQNMIFQL